MSKTRKYFGETPLDGPTAINALYKDMKNNNHNSTNNVNRPHNHLYPSIDELEHYDRICKGSSQKIIELIDRDQKHRHKLEISDMKSKYRACVIQSFVLLLFASVIIVATLWLAYKGYSTSAIITVIFGMIAVISMSKNIVSMPKKRFLSKNKKHKNRKYR